MELIKLYVDSYTLPFSRIDIAFIEDFKLFLMDAPCGGTKKGTISQNTASTYFSIFKAGPKQAFVEGYLMVDISAKVKGIPGKQVRREYLTLEELEKLAETPFIVFGTHSLQTSWQKVLTFIPSVK